MREEFQEFDRLVNSKDRFLIVCHIHPDGDAIGSLLALGLSLRESGKKVAMVCSDGVPTVYGFLEGSSEITKELNPDFRPEVLICVDCAEKERVALNPEVWDIPGPIIVNIDHHITNQGFGALNIIEVNAAATGEIVYQLLEETGRPRNRKTGLALYTAIATDTGFFRFANTSDYSLEVCSQLVKRFQIEPGKVAEYVHEQKSYNSIRLLGEVLSTIKLECNGKVAWAVLDQGMFTKFPVENEETENYVNYARAIEGVEVGILFKELRPNEVKLSWRSSAAVDVSKFAAYFGGGGHARAAGCNLNGSMEEVIDKVLSFVANYYSGG
ncbi:MAG: bifunctional oligoribonuclease/PAP phosphatase NrnA [Firmicutes bacterium]|nr:bifunctional oligoribonuclease/PAP phosphatase NrnA [Bacillota bacterium]